MQHTGIDRTSPSGSAGGVFSPITQAASHAAAIFVENLMTLSPSQQPSSYRITKERKIKNDLTAKECQ
jgi:hypothetical protein